MQKVLISFITVFAILMFSSSYVSAQDPYGPAHYCGDGVVDTGEQCDDGNTTSGDGCSSTCQTETVPETGLLDNMKAQLLIGSGMMMASFALYMYGKNNKSKKIMNTKYREDFEKIVYEVVD
jgi:cysteine-rich repeat protein